MCEKYYCEICEKEYKSISGLKAHLKYTHDIVAAMNENNTCKCGREFPNTQALYAHNRWCLIHRNGKEPVAANTGKPSPLKGKKLEEYCRNPELARKRMSDAMVVASAGRKHKEETKLKLSIARMNAMECNSVHSKWFDVDGVKVQGTWEREIALLLKQKNIKFSRVRLRYNNHRHYTPDFFLHELGVYLEIKGWLSNRDIVKYKKFFLDHPEKLIILVRNFDGRNNYDDLVHDRISIFDCENLMLTVNK